MRDQGIEALLLVEHRNDDREGLPARSLGAGSLLCGGLGGALHFSDSASVEILAKSHSGPLAGLRHERASGTKTGGEQSGPA